jgi:hypothetical protein
MTDQSIRSTLTAAVGTLDYVHAALSRAEHGVDRDTVARAREHLKATSSDLLVLRARLFGERPATSDPHELFNRPFA